MTRKAGPYLIVSALVLLFFWPLVLRPAEVLYSPHSDFIDLHVPAKRFLVQATRQYGELPLWCPYELSGSPFVHDIQAAIFYPPHLFLHVFPTEHVGAVLSWLVVLHVILAGWGGVAYARSRGLSPVGAAVAGIGCAFAGRWLLHLLAGGHYIVIGLAWLPWALLLQDQAIRRGRLGWAAAAGAAFALLVLGTHPQWTFYAGLFVALWGLGAALFTTATFRQALGRWLLTGGCLLLVACGLTAIQLLPTLEAAALTTRAGGVGWQGCLDGGMRSLMFPIGPALTPEPHELQWEDRGGLTVLWLTAAIIGGVLSRGRARFEAVVTVGLVLFAVGGSALLQGLPLFRLFRQPPRMLVLVGLPVALFAGQAVDALLGAGWAVKVPEGLARKALALVLLLTLGSTAAFAVRARREGLPLEGHVYWLALLLTVPLAAWLLRQAPARRGLAAWAWLAVLTVDALALTAGLVEVRPEGDLYRPPTYLQALANEPPGQGRVLDRSQDGDLPLGAGAPLAMVHGVEALRGYNSLDYRRYKEYLQFTGGTDGPLLPFTGPLTFPLLGNFPVAEQGLLDLLQVRYLLQPAADPVPDGWRRTLLVDPSPRVFSFVSGGVRDLPPVALYEARRALPRAFVIFESAPLPPRPEVLDALRQTDFRRVVLLEDDEPPPVTVAPSPPRAATIRCYQPNRVEVTVADGAAGWLVLGDLWYPGWTCSIDGKAATLLRANFLFRAVVVPPGEHTVVFTFAPGTLQVGKYITLTTVVLLVSMLPRLFRPGRHKGPSYLRCDVEQCSPGL
jgi:hypothetical protein